MEPPRALTDSSLLPAPEYSGGLTLHGALQPEPSLSFLPFLLDHFTRQTLSPAFVHQALGLVQSSGVTGDTRDALLLTAALLEVRQAVEQGSSGVPLTDFCERWSQQLPAQWGAVSPEDVHATLQAHPRLIGPPEATTPLVQAFGLLFQHRSHHQERALAEALQERQQLQAVLPAAAEVRHAWEDVRHTHPLRHEGQPLALAPEQQLASLLALTAPTLLISGGPGTGKTSVVTTVLRLMARLAPQPLKPVLGAPTGRAARRLLESLRAGLGSLEAPPEVDRALGESLKQSQTLHGLLGYSPRLRQFHRHALNPLTADVIIIDEASMIDLELMTHLFQATQSRIPGMPSVPRVILLGDPGQLPAVGTGAAFLNLLSEPDFWVAQHTSWLHQVLPEDARPAPPAPPSRPRTFLPTVELRQSFRQQAGGGGGAILDLASAIRNPDAVTPEAFRERMPELGSLEAWGASGVALHLRPRRPRAHDALLQTWLDRFHRSDRLRKLREEVFTEDDLHTNKAWWDDTFAELHHTRLLTLTRVLPSGTHSLNDRIRQLLGVQAPGVFPGAPIIATQNSHERQIFNGDQGVCLKIRESPEKAPVHKLVFPVDDGYQTFYDHELRNLELAYAITVHKSQGSEYRHVALILPDSEDLQRTTVSSLVSREMVYTAVTRAKQSVLLSGTWEVWQQAVQQTQHRHSGLPHWLHPDASFPQP